MDDLITFEEALRLTLQNSISFGDEEVLLESAVGRVLSEDVIADRPFPPFDRVCMDGIAIDYRSFAGGTRFFPKQSMAPAGAPQDTLKDSGSCIEIMTGASLPIGCDTIVRYEDLERKENGFEILTEVRQGQNIHYRGEDTEDGKVILPKGKRLKAIDISLAASVGKAYIKVLRLPKVAVISSGFELIPVDQQPEPHQVRMSNVYMVLARLKELGIEGNRFHIMDEEEDIKQKLSSIIDEHDVLLLSGGVSKGTFDLIPSALQDLGVQKLFHFIRQRPGKPMWLGRKADKMVFAFPGNPVSTLACMHVYFIPWLRMSLGLERESFRARLSNDVHFRPDLTYFSQASITQDEEGVNWAEVSHGGGSGDMVHPSSMDGFLILPRGKELFKKGEVFPFVPFHPIFE